MTMSAHPIRIALFGLSASAKTSWAQTAHLPYLLSNQAKGKYVLVALVNSSLAAAEAAKKHFGLPSVKTYGSPDDVAKDVEVDLLVICTRVDNHAASVKPSIEAGKAVYIEWPMTQSAGLTASLLSHSAPAIAGLQARFSRPLMELRNVLASKRIGKILSSTLQAYGCAFPTHSLPQSLSYFADREVGGSSATIDFGHMIDFVHHVLGEFVPGSLRARAQLQRPTLRLTDARGDDAGEIRSDVPDLLIVFGEIQPSDHSVPGATLSITYRNGQPFKAEPGMHWTINGEMGEIRIVSVGGPYLNLDVYSDQGFSMEIHDHDSDELEIIGWQWETWQEELPVLSRQVASVYERYATWSREGGEVDWPTIQQAYERQKEIESILSTCDPVEHGL